MAPRALPPDALEMALLTYLLSRHPAPVPEDEVAQAFAGDDWEGAAAALEADGLAHRGGGLLRPSRAAVRFNQLL